MRAIVCLVLGLTVTAAHAPALPDEPSVKAFEITASRFRFEPASVEVKEGDRVALTVRSADTIHGISIPEFKVKTTVPKGGAPVTVQFVATKAGTFLFECSEYCGSGHRQMKGRLVVAARAR